MALMTWGPMLQIGYGDIDAQHKQLVAIVNELDEAMRTGKGREVVARVLEELIEYTRFHFAFEEKLMDKHGIPGSAAHKQEHRKLIADVGAFKAKFDTGAASVTIELMAFLRNWLSKHILKTDRGLARALLSVGAKSAA